MDTDLVASENEVIRLRELLAERRAEVAELERRYNRKIAKMQVLCEKEGHQFVAEPDDDYHNTRIVYTCKRCDYFTRYKPMN